MNSDIIVQNDYLHFSINRKQKYSLYKGDLNNAISVHFPDKNLIDDAPIFENISKVIHHLVTSKRIEGTLLEKLKEKTIELYPDNVINWQNTSNFLKVYNEFCLRFKTKYKSEEYEPILGRMDERNAARVAVFDELKNEGFFNK